MTSSFEETSLKRRVPLPVALLVISLALPMELSFQISGLLITMPRVVLLAMFVPVIIRMVQSSRLFSYDYLLLGFAFWVFLALTVNHGISKGIESGGVLALEIIFSYFIARTYLISPKEVIATIKLLVIIVLIILPFVAVETLSSHHFIHDFFASVTGVRYPMGYDARLGFLRAAGPFSHPILLGVFSSSLIGLAWYGLWKEGKVKKLLRMGVLVVVSLTTLSSAPILLAIFQFIGILWNRIAGWFRQRWKFAIAGAASIYVFLLFWSSSSPVMVVLSRITLSPATSYYRMLIWDYGTAEVSRNPVFGIGKHDWHRAVWMVTDSIDNFWLKEAMQYGIPAVILIGLCTILIIRKMIKLMDSDVADDYKMVCRGWVVSMISLSLIGLTVDFFSSIHVFFYLMLGMGAALLNIERTEMIK